MSFIFLTNERGEGNGHDYHDFNALINQGELLDLPIADRSFTWSTSISRISSSLRSPTDCQGTFRTIKIMG